MNNVQNTTKRPPAAAWGRDYQALLPVPLLQQRTQQERADIVRFCTDCYRQHYPAIEHVEDEFYARAVTLYTRAGGGQVSSALRLVYDSPRGLPEDALFADSARRYRQRGLRLAEAGRFVSSQPNRSRLLAYYVALYRVAVASGIDVILMVTRKKDLRFHQHLLGVTELPHRLDNGFGSRHTFVAAAWQIDATRRRFRTSAQPPQPVPRLSVPV